MTTQQRHPRRPSIPSTAKVITKHNGTARNGATSEGVMSVDSVRTVMLEKLAQSALTADDAVVLDLTACAAQDAAKLGLKHHMAGFKIPYFDLDGKPTQFFRYRYLESTKTGFAALTNAKPQKYAQPAGSMNELYLPPLATGTSWRAIAGNPKVPVIVTEGELKAACATKLGFPTIGLGGVWCFKPKDMPLLPMFDEFEWEGRTVYICYDSDAVTNVKVMDAENALARELSQLGARPFIVRLPNLQNGDSAKTGLDDFLVEEGSDAFRTLREDAAEWKSNDADPFTDLGNAYRVREHFGDVLLFVPGLGWLVWDGTRWHPSNLKAQRMVSGLGAIIRREAGAIEDRERADDLWKFARRSEGAGKIEAAMKLAVPLLMRNANEFDADPFLLGCNNGVVDLRTGKLTPPNPKQLITKTTGHNYDPKAECPTWARFLQRIFRSQPELPAFMQQLAGYWLTGLTDPPYLAVLYGVGANGKSTLVEAIRHAMGDYASAAPPKLLMMKYGSAHPTELASLQGRRFVAAAESGEGGRLDEERIKALTGSDAITARRMREDFYTFIPTHKLALMTNHKPIVRGQDEGIWRRLRLIPFDEFITEKERDQHLSSKLRAEAPGILAWAAAGARRFLTDSKLRMPKVVVEATNEYRTDSDVIGMFIKEMCVEDKNGTVLSAALYMAYEGWARANNEHVLSSNAFFSRLRDRGLKSIKVGKQCHRGWRGLALRSGDKF